MRAQDVIDQLGPEALKNASFVNSTYDFNSKGYESWEKAANEFGLNPAEPYSSNSYEPIAKLFVARARGDQLLSSAS